MSFIDSYKHLEKLCGEILNDDRKVSAYIDEMINTTNGSLYVNNWDEDLKRLKHYRWIRNQIVHDPACNEADMCNIEDERWLNDFYSRIISQNDPLSIYRKAKSNDKVFYHPFQEEYTYNQKKSSNNLYTRQNSSCLGIIFFIIIALFFFFFLTNKI